MRRLGVLVVHFFAAPPAEHRLASVAKRRAGVLRIALLEVMEGPPPRPRGWVARLPAKPAVPSISNLIVHKFGLAEPRAGQTARSVAASRLRARARAAVEGVAMLASCNLAVDERLG